MSKDAMRIESTFTRSLVSKLLEREIKKRYGYSVHLALDSLSLSIDEDANKMSANVNIRATAPLDILVGATKVLYENEN